MTSTNGDANGHVPWNEKLLAEFENDEIGVRPQVWCTDCRKAIKGGQKACGKGEGKRQHKAEKCADCWQNITTAHLHLFYVGHADLTQRLLTADPYWTWEPMARDVDPEVLKAAIASGNPEIVKTVLDYSPPRMEQFEVADYQGRTHIERGMWMRLILHDDQGKVVTMIGFGDAKGKDWTTAPGDALKEIIGDGLRNAGMRRGAALGLWRKQDREQVRKERQEYDPDSNPRDRMAMFDDDAKDAAADQRGEPADKDAQVLADLAWQLARQGKTTEQIRAACHDPAARQHKLGAWVRPPWDPDQDARKRLSDVLTRCRRITDGKETFPEPAGTAEAGA